MSNEIATLDQFSYLTMERFRERIALRLGENRILETLPQRLLRANFVRLLKATIPFSWVELLDQKRYIFQV